MPRGGGSKHPRRGVERSSGDHPVRAPQRSHSQPPSNAFLEALEASRRHAAAALPAAPPSLPPTLAEGGRAVTAVSAAGGLLAQLARRIVSGSSVSPWLCTDGPWIRAVADSGARNPSVLAGATHFPLAVATSPDGSSIVTSLEAVILRTPRSTPLVRKLQGLYGSPASCISVTARIEGIVADTVALVRGADDQRCVAQRCNRDVASLWSGDLELGASTSLRAIRLLSGGELLCMGEGTMAGVQLTSNAAIVRELEWRPAWARDHDRRDLSIVRWGQTTASTGGVEVVAGCSAPDGGPLFLLGRRNGCVDMWDTRTSRAIKCAGLPSSTAAVEALPSGLVLFADIGTHARIVDPRRWDLPLALLRGYCNTPARRPLSVGPAGAPVLAGVGSDGGVRVWDAANGALLRSLRRGGAWADGESAPFSAVGVCVSPRGRPELWATHGTSELWAASDAGAW
jgi:hypothetical protein